MFKVYLVDDEEWLISELKNIIDWGTYGFEICGFNTDPFEAEKEIISLSPSLVICDIRMDGMNGLELARRIREKTAEIGFCFLSAYDKFEYAVTAMKLGAVDYLTKPIKTQELVSVLEKLKRAKLFALGSEVYEIAENGSRQPVNERIKRAIDGFGFFDKGKKARCVVFHGNFDDEEFGSDERSVLLIRRDGYAGYLYYGTDIKKIDKICAANGISAGISAEFSAAGEIAENLKTAKLCSRQFFITGKPCAHVYSDNPHTDDVLKKIYGIESKHELKKFIADLGVAVDKSGIDVCGADKIFRAAAIVALKLGIDGFDGEFMKRSVCYAYPDINAAIRDFVGKTEAACGAGVNAVIENIINDVRENYAEKQSLSEYADKYGFNASYLSWLFKKQTGKNFSEFVLNYRIDKAKELMFGTDKTMHEISYTVGYDDYFHFSKLFKKHEGLSPTEYKKKYFSKNS